MEIETVGKVADAVSEVAKTGGKAIDAGSDAGKFLSRIMGDLVLDGVGLIGDRIKYYRTERVLLLIDKTQRRLEERGVKGYKLVPPNLALPLIESAAMENDDDLHTKWAELLFTAMSDGQKGLDRRFIDTLSRISPTDAFALDCIIAEINESNASIEITNKTPLDEATHTVTRRVPYVPFMGSYLRFIKKVAPERVGKDGRSFSEVQDDGYHWALENFENLGIILCSKTVFSTKDGGEIQYSARAINDYVFTDFGLRFCEAIGLSSKVKIEVSHVINMSNHDAEKKVI